MATPADLHRASTMRPTSYTFRCFVAMVSIALLPTVPTRGVCAETFRVASISFEPVKFDLAGNADKLEACFRRAARGGAQLAVAPEGALEGYVVNEIIAGEVPAERMRDVALPIDSPAITRFTNLARELHMCLVFGFAEEIGHEVFNCAVFIDHHGTLCGKYHKMQFAEGYHDSWWFNRLGQQVRAFDTPLGRCGMLICNDRWNPQLARIAALDGAQFLIIPAYGSTSTEQDEAVLARGVETGLPIVEANVGVSLIIQESHVAAVGRQRDGVTYADITTSPLKPIDGTTRDQMESEFLRWREVEMPARLAQRAADRALGKPLESTEQEGEIRWYNAQDLGVEGKAWDETDSYYDRLPSRARQTVRPAVWSLSRDSAGMCVRFMTDADSLHARWTLTSANLAMPHMPATGVSGVDLYVRHGSAWRWLATGQPTQQANTVQLVAGMTAIPREYLLYLPLYNGVTSLHVGVSNDASLWRKSLALDRKPIVFWGTSITQGGCASRPGMAHPAILGRRLERPVINLGFSGNGKLEAEVAQLIAEIDAAAYVIDCLPNLTAELVTERVRPVVEIIRTQRSDTPILLVEDRTYSNAFLVESRRQANEANRAALREAYRNMQDAGIRELYYLNGDGLLGRDGEDTVDGSHPTDLGFLRQATAFEAALRPVLDGPNPGQENP